MTFIKMIMVSCLGIFVVIVGYVLNKLMNINLIQSFTLVLLFIIASNQLFNLYERIGKDE